MEQHRRLRDDNARRIRNARFARGFYWFQQDGATCHTTANASDIVACIDSCVASGPILLSGAAVPLRPVRGAGHLGARPEAPPGRQACAGVAATLSGHVCLRLLALQVSLTNLITLFSSFSLASPLPSS